MRFTKAGKHNMGEVNYYLLCTQTFTYFNTE